MTEVTRILESMERGDPGAAERLLPLVYDELRKLAARQMAQERPGQTLDATALVHEAYLRLLGDQRFENRRHFFAAAAEAMRRILVEQARRKGRLKHGGAAQRSAVDLVDLPTAIPDKQLLALDEALTRLGHDDPDKARLIHLRFFLGMTNEEAADVLGIAAVTAKRHWRFAKAWLRREVQDADSE